MPDQLFESLTEDVTVRPLPAAEVRRRGDRRRRREGVAAVVGGVAAIAAVVVPLTLAHGGANRSLPPVATSPTASSTVLTTVPAGFPLTSGLPRRDGASNQPLTAGPLTAEEQKACGKVVWSAQRPVPTVGGASVEYHDGSEGGIDRSLALYADAAHAQQALQGIEDGLARCHAVDAGTGTVAALKTATAGDPNEVWVVRWTDESGQLTGEGLLGSAPRVGNALLLDAATFLGAGDDTVVQHEAALLASRETGLAAAMCVFSGGPCTVAHDDTPTPSSAVLGPTGYDRLRIGMSYADALASGDIEQAATDGRKGLQLVGHPDAGLCLSRKDGLMAIFLGAGMSTPERIRLGSKADDLIAAYPDLRPYDPDSKVGGPGIFRADAADGTWYEIDVKRNLKVSTVILRQDHQTCFE